MQFRHFVGLAALIAAVPLQMYLMKYNENFKALVADIVETLPEYVRNSSVIDLTEYVGTAKGYLRSAYDYFGISKPDEDDDDDDDDDDSSRPREFDDLPQHMIRDFRPPHLEFRIGDVILTRDMVIGVVIGWWIDRTDLTKEPIYYILSDNEEIKEIQSQMIGIENIQIKHKNKNNYFKKFDGIRYTPKKWLQNIYPRD